MKLAKVRIENFRQLGGERPFELDFTDPLGRVRDFVLLVGPNTCGKTTILDAIAAAIGPSLELPTTRGDFVRSPRTVVRRGALTARVTCWLRFSDEEIETTRALFALAGRPEQVPDMREVRLTWVYPDQRSDFGYSQTDPPLGWVFLKGRVTTARLLPTGRVDWSWFDNAGGVFTFDQERTGLGKTISREVWNIIHGKAEGSEKGRRTSDPRTILIDLAIQSRLRREADVGPDAFRLIQERYARICTPRRIVGAIPDDLGGYDMAFHDGSQEYRYDGLSSGEKMALLLLVRFAAEHIHRSIVLIDELELNQHPVWQRRLLHMVPQMGDDNQIIATTHSSYLRDAVRPDAVIDLGSLQEVAG